MSNITITECINGSINVYDRHKSELEFYNKFTLKHLVEQITVPILVVMGLPGTIISFIIWSKKQMRYSSSIYLSVLAISDSLFIIAHIIWHLDSTYNIPTINNPIMCNIFPTINYFLQYMSPILTLAFTVERYISICWPFSREKLCSINRAAKVSLFLAVVSFIVASPMLYFFRYESVNKKRCMAIFEIYNNSEASINPKQLMFVYNLITELLMFACIPFVILIINSRVIFEMWRIYKSINLGMRSSENSHKGATTVTLLSVSFYLICACLPLTLVHLSVYIIPEGDLCLTDKQIKNDPIWNKLFLQMNTQVFIEFFSLSYYGAKFYIYLGTSEAFRAAFCQLFSISNKEIPEYKSSRTERKIKNEHISTKHKQPHNDIESVNLLSLC